MGGEQLNFDSPAIRVRAGFVGRIFYSPARRTFVVASKFPARQREARKMYGSTLSTTGRSLISNERAAAGVVPQTTLINRRVVVSKSS